MGDEKIDRVEFNEFKKEFTERLDAVISTIDSHIAYQKKRNDDILKFLNSDYYIQFKTKLKKHEKTI